MPIQLESLADQTRILFTVELKPIQGARFQPTGFPDLGAATYQAGKPCLLLESPQSMANRLEAVCWDEAKNDLTPALAGLSYVRVEQDGEFLTSSITEAHRLNSPYILESKDKTFFDKLRGELDVLATGPVNRKVLAQVVLKYDINALLHGLFLAKKELAGGRLRVARVVSAFVEAENVQVAMSGGVKNDHVDPQGDTAKGFGNVPFSREEYTAESIKGHFSIDLAQICGYGLGEGATRLLILLALYKIRVLLDGDLRFRTACDLEVVSNSVVATRPEGFRLPELQEIEGDLRVAIADLADQMTLETVNYTK